MAPDPFAPDPIDEQEGKSFSEINDDEDTDTDPAPDRNRRDEREQTYRDAFGDADDDGGGSGGTSNDERGTSGGSSTNTADTDSGAPTPSAGRGPSADERADTIRSSSPSEDNTTDDGAPSFNPLPDTFGDDSGVGGGDGVGSSGGRGPSADERADAQRSVAIQQNIDDDKGGDVTGNEFAAGLQLSDTQEEAVSALESETVIDLGREDVNRERVQQNGRTVFRFTLSDDARDREQRARGEAASEINTASDRRFAGVDRRMVDVFSGGDGISEAQQVLVERQRERQTPNQPRTRPQVTGAQAGGNVGEDPGSFSEGAAAIANSDLDPGQRAVGYTRLGVRGAFGEGVEDAIFQSPTGGFAGNPDTTSISGPGVNANPTGTDDVLESGGQGELNRDVTDSLTRGRGLLSEEQEQTLREDVSEEQERFSLDDEAEAFVTDTTGSEKAGAVAAGAGSFTGDAFTAADQALLTADTATEVTSNLPRTVDQYGAGETALTAAEVGGRATGATVQQLEANPYRTAGSIGAGIVTGLAAGRAIQAAPSAARSASIRARGGRVVDFEDVSDPPRTTSGGLPAFSDDAVGDSDVARREFVEQARETDVAGDEPVAFSGRSADAVGEYGGFGRNYEAPEGGSELPGQFQSADLSRLRISQGGRSSYRPRIGLPDPNVRSSRVLAERDVDVDTIPASRAGSGYAVQQGDDVVETGLTRAEANALADDVGGERVPDPTTPGYRYLTEEADPESSFVRADSDITPEQEAVAPPGARFEQDGGVFGIRIGGRRIPGTDRRVGGEIVPGRLTRRVDADVGTNDVDVDADDTFTQREVAQETTDAVTESLRRQQDPTTPFVPVGTPTTSPPDGSTQPETTAPTSGSFAGRVTQPASTGPTRPASDPVGSGFGSATAAAESPVGESPTPSEPQGSTGGGSTSTTSSSPPSGGGGGGSPTTPPGFGDTPTQPGGRRFDSDADADEDGFETSIVGARRSDLTDFVNPLTGEVLRTQGGDDNA